MLKKFIPFILLLFLSIPYFAEAQLLSEDQSTYYISTNGVRVRSAPEENAPVLGLLDLNDEVRIHNTPSFSLSLSLSLSNDKYVEIQIIKTDSPIISSEKYFIFKEFLLVNPVDYKEFTGKYFIVLNVASETLRLYERNCIDKDCLNKMVMETEIVVGQDKNTPKDAKGKGRSILGSFRVTGWSKFYEDNEGHYPAWYKDGYPEVPKANDHNIGLWFSNQYMPENNDGSKSGKMRGAFGWYTMFLAPKPFGQWVHGTIGWGEDKDYYIKAIKKILPNIFTNPRSSGCARNNNEAIAYLRQMIETGTPVIKIYAEEKIFDPTLSNYPENVVSWKYVLTKNKNLKADREDVLKALGITSAELDRYWETKRLGDVIILDPKDSLNQVLEVGTYNLDNHPDAIAFTPGEKMSKFERKLHRNGNVYGIKSWNMSGVYYVDTGILNNYKHPSVVLESSGFPDEVTPPWMMTK
jgi:hypothetical protein